MRNKITEALHIRAPRLNQLNILSQLASDSHLTQAVLARRCRLSVAMVNNYMKELHDAGLIEYRRRSSKNIAYPLTPAGHEFVERLEQELIQEIVELFAESKAKVRDLILNGTREAIRRVVLFGSGDIAELAFHALESAGVKVIGVCDGEPQHAGREWCGRELINPSQIRYMTPDAVVIATLHSSEEIYNSLAPLKEDGVHLIRLDGRAGNNSGKELPRNSKSGSLGVSQADPTFEKLDHSVRS
jgi:predicted transcriptional regulator